MTSYWLFKTEPHTFGLHHLKNLPDQTTDWEGVRNYQARNYLRSQIKVGDLAFFYHSSCKEPGIVAIVKVVKAGHPDLSAFNPNSPYFCQKSDPNHPKWFQVSVKLDKILKAPITLATLRKHQNDLRDFPLLKKGNRLSVLPVKASEWTTILNLVE